jgi:hypothetical protein
VREFRDLVASGELAGVLRSSSSVSPDRADSGEVSGSRIGDRLGLALKSAMHACFNGSNKEGKSMHTTVLAGRIEKASQHSFSTRPSCLETLGVLMTLSGLWWLMFLSPSLANYLLA